MHGDAWGFVTHDSAAKIAYRWGEDGLAGFCDDRQRLCFAPAFWNGHDDVVKERLFGLSGPEGNHGEDVKELYYYLDATPSHSFQRMLYKYPQRAFPYEALRRENRRRSKEEREFEITDTDAFIDNRYFDIFIDYAKDGPEDILWRITAHNRGPKAAPLHVLAQTWLRNTWAWGLPGRGPKPQMQSVTGTGALDTLRIDCPDLGPEPFFLYADGQPRLLVCDNETNAKAFPDRVTNPEAEYYKDGISNWVLTGDATGLNPDRIGTRAAFAYPLTVPAGKSVTLRLRLTRQQMTRPFQEFDEIYQRREAEADAFYQSHYAEPTDAERCRIQRQAWAGLFWSKTYYRFDVRRWLQGDPATPPPPALRRQPGHRNVGWEHLRCGEVMLMPDKWEFPWFAAWDLAFHAVPVAQIDPWLAKQQLLLLLRERLMHPSGQLPAYEWAFSDVNPPVHAWAAWRVYKITAKHGGEGDTPIGGDTKFLEAVFQKLLVNFTWWVNRKDREGRNLFQGGFLGLDNIGVFDRSAPLPGGGSLEQADATSWMAMYALTMMRMALELTRSNPNYEDMASKFFEHFLYIAGAMGDVGGDQINLWDDQDEFYYDALLTPDGRHQRLKVRSMVGLIPLFAVEVIDPELLEAAPHFAARLTWFLNNRPELAALVSRWQVPGRGERQLLSLLRGHRMKALLKRMLDEAEFLSEYGIRSLSRTYADRPFSFSMDGSRPATVAYEPGESHSSMFGGNSNWRGPIWMPVNFLLIESLQRFHHYYGEDFLVEFPTGSGHLVTLRDVADELARRLIRLFLPDPVYGTRPLNGDQGRRYRDDPHFKDLLLFPEYFHGDNGRGCGASHQTGWTALLAKLIQMEADDRREREAT